jgi:N utilization substance protein A
MKSDFTIALTQLAAERNLPKEVILKTIETALAASLMKERFGGNENISVKIVPQTGEVKVQVQKLVVKKVSDPYQEILLSEARKLRENVQPGEMVEVESTPENIGRILAQTTKQVMLQRLHEAERDTIFGEYANKEEDIISGVVQYIEPRQIIIDLGRAEALLPLPEQLPTEHYRAGQRIKLYLIKVLRSAKGTQLIVSRAHPGLLRRLFELEIPEIYSGTVELKGLAREAGYRSKVAVAAQQPGVDPVGCCVGLRSIRIQNITKELNGERIDIVQWDPDPAVFIANALSPASVVKVEIDEDKGANVIVPDKQLSLAIGKGGQNARLAARLTGWRIDIKSVSMVEAEAAEKAAAEQELAPAAVAGEEVGPAAEVLVAEPPAEEVVQEPVAEETILPEKEVEPELALAEAKDEEPTPAEALEATEEYAIEELISELETVTETFELRFAEDLPMPSSAKTSSKAKKGKQKGSPKGELSDGKTKSKKTPKRQHVVIEDEDYEG